MRRRLLQVEDSEDDALLIARRLRREGMDVETLRVDTPAAFLEALAKGPWDAVLTDHAMPHFSSTAVLELLREHAPDLPCVIVSGRIGEEAVVAAMRAGAVGFVGKDHFGQLEPAVTRALREAEERRARRAAEEALRVSEERYALALQGANDGIWDWDLGTDLVFRSDRWKAMLGYGPDELGPAPAEWLDRIHPQDRECVRAALDLHLGGGSPQLETEHRVKHRDGRWRWMLVRGIAVRDETGAPARLAGSMTDITQRKEAEEQIAHGALHDALTGLPNRALLLDRVAASLGRVARHSNRCLAVLALDLDRFKVVNDALGHGEGDQLLRHVAEALQASLQPGDTVARTGGDEFAVLVEDLHDPSEATRTAQRLQDALSRPWQLHDRDVFSSASIGVAIGSAKDDRSAEDLLRDADTAMFRAKALGRARHVVFESGMHERALKQLQLESDLRRAVDRAEFDVLYQPMISLTSGEIVGFESLVRWRHPTRGVLSPAEFVPFAEESGLIVDIGRQVMQTACGHLRRWGEIPGVRPFTVSINLSGRQFAQPDLLGEIRAIVAEGNLDPRRIHLEITETVLIENQEGAAELLRRLHAMNIRVSLDDFGTGYSSLSYLHRFRVDTLKIDKSFVDRMTDSVQIVGTIAALAGNLGMDVVAEGVETVEQARLLRELHCTNAQGYLFSRPRTAREAEGLLREGRRWLLPA